MGWRAWARAADEVGDELEVLEVLELVLPITQKTSEGSLCIKK